MVNQQKGMQQDTAYSAVVVNYPHLFIVFDPKRQEGVYYQFKKNY